MSRIGKAPIAVPSGVTVTLDGQSISVKGPKGELSRTYSELISVRQDGEELVVERSGDDRDSRAQHGLVRSLIQNMVTGVTQGFQKDLEIVGVGYRAQAKGQGLELSLGFSHPVVVDAPDGISFNVPAPTRIEVHGIDKQLVGQVAANVRRVRKPDAYHGKGVRFLGEHIPLKPGKAGAK